MCSGRSGSGRAICCAKGGRAGRSEAQQRCKVGGERRSMGGMSIERCQPRSWIDHMSEPSSSRAVLSQSCTLHCESPRDTSSVHRSGEITCTCARASKQRSANEQSGCDGTSLPSNSVQVPCTPSWQPSRTTLRRIALHHAGCCYSPSLRRDTSRIVGVRARPKQHTSPRARSHVLGACRDHVSRALSKRMRERPSAFATT